MFISLKEALPLFTKKLQCFSEIQASPKLLSKGTDSLINSQTFLFVCDLGFLKVLPLVLIRVGCAFSFFFTKFSISFLIWEKPAFDPLNEALKNIKFSDKLLFL